MVTTTSRVESSSSSLKSSVPLHRCRFPDYTPSSITCLALTPTSFDARDLGCIVDDDDDDGQGSRGILAVGRSNGTVELMIWGGYQGWVNWRTLPSSFPPPPSSTSNSKPTTLLSHLAWSHQTTLSESDMSLYSDEPQEAKKEIESLKRGKGLRLFGVGGTGSELVEWEWNNHHHHHSTSSFTSSSVAAAVGMIKSTLPTLPPIFSLSVSPTSAVLAISCEDSTIRLINILDGELELMSKIELGTGTGGGKVRALSLTWGKPRSLTSSPDDDDEDEDEEMGDIEEKKGKDKASSLSLPSSYSTRLESYLLAGCSNSTIRRFDAPTNSSFGLYRGTLRMTLDRLKGEQTVVWCLTTLGDGTVVSGDSMGNVKFWDGTMGTQLQSFKSHKSDILCLGVGTDGKSIYTSGIDQKTVEFRQVKVTRTSSTEGQVRWIQASGRRLHSHDVRAIVISPPYEPFSTSSPSSSSSSLVPVMTSAGLDLSLILTPVASPLPTSSKRQPSVVMMNPVSNNPSITFESTVHRRQAYVGSRSVNLPFSLTTKPITSREGGNGRLLLGRKDRSISIWKLDKPKSNSSTENENENEEEEESQGGGWEKLLDLEFKLQTNLIASEISKDGKWFAVSDLYETKLYRLITSRSTGELIPKRQKTFLSTLTNSSSPLQTNLGTGSSCIKFSSKSDKLFLTSAFGASVAVTELGEEDEMFRVEKVFGQGQTAVEEKQKKNNVNGNGGDLEMNQTDSDSEDEDEETIKVAGKGGNTIVVLTSSEDGKWLATADLDRTVEIYNLETMKHYLTLPTPPSVPTALAFLPSSNGLEPTLVLSFSTNILLLYGLVSKRFHPWALPLSSSKYNSLTDIREPSLGITFKPTIQSSDEDEDELVILVWGANWVGRVDLNELKNTNFGGGSNSNENQKKNKKKQFRLEADRKRAREEDPVLPLPNDTNNSSGSGSAMIDIKITRKYQPLFLFDFIQPQTSLALKSNAKKSVAGTGRAVELVAVERTWYDIVGSLPQAFFQTGVFGT